MTTRNPIYQAFRTLGLINQLERNARMSGAHSALYDVVRQERAAVRSMWQRGVISYEEYENLHQRIGRTLHARLIRDYVRRGSLSERRKATRLIMRTCPPGATAYHLRMGYATHA